MAAKSATAKKTVTAKKTTAPAPKKVVRTRKPKISETVESLDAPDYNLSAYVPDPDIATKYVGRKVHGIWDKILADEAMKRNWNILLMGDTGAGKTLFGEAYASALSLPYYSLPCDVSIDPSALFGRMQPTDVPGKFEWQDGPVSQIIRNGGVLNISEVNFMPPKIAASLYPLLDGRRYIPLLGHKGEVVRAHRGTEGEKPCWCSLPADECNKRRVLIVADMNPQYRGTMELNAAFKNRWEFVLPWGYDDTVEEKLVASPTLRDVVAQLRAMIGTELVTPISTNMMMEFEKFALNPALGLEFSIQNFKNAFELQEQDAVYRVLDLNRGKFEKDLRFIERSASKKPVKEDELEEIEFEFEEED